MKAKQTVSPDPVKIFAHAASFHKSYELLVESASPRAAEHPDKALIGIVAYPAMVLSVFASELYIKTLVCIENGVVPNTHDLKKLFAGLSVATRHELDNLWDIDIRQPERMVVIEAIRKRPGGENFRLDLRYAIEKGANAFVELRYFYEKEQSFFLLSDFPYLLRKVILKRFPSWGTIVPKPSEGHYLHAPGAAM